MSLNQRFAKLAGLCWHEISLKTPYMIDGVRVGKLYTCSCGIIVHKADIKEHTENSNPDYAAAPWLVLEVMRKKDEEQYTIFVMHLVSLEIGSGCFSKLAVQGYVVLILNKYILDRSGKLRDAAIEWIEKREE